MPSAPRHYAHSLQTHSKDDWELLPDHLERVADGDGSVLLGAAQFAEAFGRAEWGRLLGLWHDLGKYSIAFQNYLGSNLDGAEGSHTLEMTHKVDHSTAGAQHAASRGPSGRLLAYCIAGHHAGLPNNEGGAAGLRERLKKPVDPIAAAPAALLGRPLTPPPRLQSGGGRRRSAFAVGFLTRMLFSCLVDADFLATSSSAWKESGRWTPPLAPRRTVVKSVGPPSNDEIVDRLNRERQALCIVDPRKHAADLFKLLKVNQYREMIEQAMLLEPV